MLLENYKPKTLADVIGQNSLIKGVENWLDERERGKALLIYGPPGTGKSLIPKLVAKKRNLSVFEISASDNRTSSSLREILRPASKEESLLKDRVILIEDIDNMGRADKGGIAEVIKTIKESSFPIIVTAKNAYDPKLKTLRLYCKTVRINKIRKDLIRNKIIEIARKEKLNINHKVIENIVENANGDIRSAINDLEIASQNLDSIGYRENEINIFETLKTIFKSQDLNEIDKNIRTCDKNLEEIFWWVEQNIPNEYKDPREIATAFEFLSKADLFKVKLLKTRNYRFKGYMKSMIAAVALAKKAPYRNFVSYKPPDRLILLGRTKSLRNRMEEFYGVIGKRLCCSRRKVKEQMPFLKIILSDSYSKIS